MDNKSTSGKSLISTPVKLGILGVLVISIVVLVFGSSVEIGKYFTPEPAPTPTIYVTPKPPTITPTTIPESAWTNYTNEELGLTFPLPSEWTITVFDNFSADYEEICSNTTSASNRNTQDNMELCPAIIDIAFPSQEPSVFKIYVDSYWSTSGLSNDRVDYAATNLNVAGQTTTGNLGYSCRNNTTEDDNCKVTDVFYDAEISGRRFTFWLSDLSEGDILKSSNYEVFSRIVRDFAPM